MSAVDELADAMPALRSSGHATGPQRAQPAVDLADVAASSGGCLQDLVDLHPWRPRSMQDWLT